MIIDFIAKHFYAIMATFFGLLMGGLFLDTIF